MRLREGTGWNAQAARRLCGGLVGASTTTTLLCFSLSEMDVKLVDWHRAVGDRELDGGRAVALVSANSGIAHFFGARAVSAMFSGAPAARHGQDRERRFRCAPVIGISNSFLV